MTKSTNSLNRELKVGDVLASEYVYGGECLIWDFFLVTKTTPKTVTLNRIVKETRYDDGRKGPHYYDDPKHCFPKTREVNGRKEYCLESGYEDSVIRRKVSYNREGTPVVKTDEFYISRGTWSGEPLEEYNLH